MSDFHSQGSLSARLTGEASSFAREHNIEIAVDADEALAALAERGVENMQHDGRTDPEAVDQALRGMTELVASAANVGELRRITRSDLELQAKALGIWPFWR